MRNCTHKSNREPAASGTPGASKGRRTDGTKFFTPEQVAARWGFHTESIRRLLRRHAMESVIVCRRRLIPVSAVERIEAEGQIARAN